jgi:hypothetical protein
LGQKGKIWFVGLEEAANFETDFEQILKSYSKEYILVEKGEIQEGVAKYGNRYTKVYDVMSKIMVGLFPIMDWRKYRNDKLLTADGNAYRGRSTSMGRTA